MKITIAIALVLQLLALVLRLLRRPRLAFAAFLIASQRSCW
jgi:hypothetical protein